MPFATLLQMCAAGILNMHINLDKMPWQEDIPHKHCSDTNFYSQKEKRKMLRDPGR